MALANVIYAVNDVTAGASLTDFTFVVNLSTMPAAWKAEVDTAVDTAVDAAVSDLSGEIGGINTMVIVAIVLALIAAIAAIAAVFIIQRKIAG